jgi:hypothetical protein
VTIDVFDMKGNKVAVILNGKQAAGSKIIEWNKIPGKVAPGVYLIRFMIGREMATRKIAIINKK